MGRFALKYSECCGRARAPPLASRSPAAAPCRRPHADGASRIVNRVSASHAPARPAALDQPIAEIRVHARLEPPTVYPGAPDRVDAVPEAGHEPGEEGGTARSRSKLDRSPALPSTGCAIDATAHRQRNLIERAFCRIKDGVRSRPAATRQARNLLAGICLAAAITWRSSPPPAPGSRPPAAICCNHQPRRFERWSVDRRPTP